ncbi:MAG: hypothetical protein JSR73_14020 [Proteobacteria bacterium]|nr:hypothetical protein [Pseudomonadota bacterium]
MTRPAITLVLLAALANAGSVLAAPSLKPLTPPSSYAPRPSAGPHVYGSPLGPPSVGPRRHHVPATPKSAARSVHAAKSRARADTSRLQPPPAPAPR